MKRLAFVAMLLASGCVTADVVPFDVVRELAPTGKLRAAITGEARGVSVDLAREVAKRAGIPLEIVPYDAAGKVTGDATNNRWDIAFLARDPRAKDIEFTAPYVIVQGSEQAMALPRGRPLAARYLREFIDEMKASGFVAQSLDKSGQKDAAVVP